MKKFFLICFIIVLSFWTIKPLFLTGFFPVHDNAQPERIYEMAKALKDGMFPVRWSDDFGYGYGYPLFNFYAPFSYYIGGFMLSLAKIDVLTATKITMGLGIVLAGVSMYFLTREFWGDLGGVVSAVLYTYAPYHAVDIYVRGDMAEFWAYAIIPFVFLGYYKVFESCLSFNNPQKDKKSILKWIIVASISYAGLILSHNLTAMMVTPFLLLIIILFGFALYKNKKPFFIRYLFYSLILGLALSAFYWIPALFELRYTNVFSQTGGGFDFHKHFVCFFQLWSSPWGYGGSAPGCVDGLSFMIGKIHILLSALSIFVAVLLSWKEKQTVAIVVSITGLIFSLLLTTETTKLMWETIKPMAFFQFPWRFLVMLSFFTSFLSGASIWFMKEKILRVKSFVYFAGVCVFVFLIIFFNAKFFAQKEQYHAQSEYFSDRLVIAWNMSEASSEYMPKNFSKPKYRERLPKGVFSFTPMKTRIENSTLLTQRKTALFDTSGDTLQSNIAYFPGWHIAIDGVEKPFTITNNGFSVPLPKGRHEVNVFYSQTFVEKSANTISLIGIVLLFTGIIFSRKNFTS